MHDERAQGGSGDGAPSEHAPSAEAIRALAAFEAALVEEARILRHDLSLGENDLAAMRLVLGGDAHGAPPHPTDIARSLGVSSAATTAILDRLERQALVRRVQTAGDRRSVEIESIPESDAPVRHALSLARSSRLRALETLDDDTLRALARALGVLTEALRADEALR